ncbi:hypothetical protein [Neobacillus mesonae]|uniref:hypothetical protein n=1 Tax=Neobacillus mesonae TaxID=1193713 RepID=UPI00288969A0|nr:hypothetical protein [Neobacillus mesonae]
MAILWTIDRGLYERRTGSFNVSMIFLGICMVIGALIIIFLVKQSGKALDNKNSGNRKMDRAS